MEKLNIVVCQILYLISHESLCLLKILAKDRMARKKAILVSTFLLKVGTHFGLDFEEAQVLITYQLLWYDKINTFEEWSVSLEEANDFRDEPFYKEVVHLFF
jgi:hypothetical protein